MGLYTVVLIAVGAKYDLTANVNVTDGMTNGAECIVEKIDYRVTNSNRPVAFQRCNLSIPRIYSYNPGYSFHANLGLDGGEQVFSNRQTIKVPTLLHQEENHHHDSCIVVLFFVCSFTLHAQWA